MDMLLELFDIMQHTSFAQRYKETNTQIVCEMTDLQKAKYLFRRMH